MTFLRPPFLPGSDPDRMLALACQFSEDHIHVIDLPYRFSSWAFDDPENVCLWLTPDRRLVAWAVLQTPFWTIDYVCDPTAGPGLHREILAWADRRARAALGTAYGRPAWFAMVFPEQTARIRDLEDAGFECQAQVGDDSWSKVLMQRSIQTPVKIFRPPAGFVVRSLAGEDEVKDYVELHQSVFESKNMTVDWRLRTLRHPAYTSNLDVVVEAPGHRLAAFCICWLHKKADAAFEGQIEPLGCHRDFRRYALGRVALSEGLHRLQSLGAQRIFVETDSYRNTAFQLYEAFDFQVLKDVLVFRKDYASK